MKGSDYIVDYLAKKGVTDIFGYPGATVCHLMDSIEKDGRIKNHLNYHEQACAFAACGYAQCSGKVGVAYANGGPGYTNLITGIINAYYDSIPTLFICGQVDTFDMVGERKIRQNGIQEIPITRISKPFTKKALKIENENELAEKLEEAFRTATSGRPGPVVLELPANIQRADIKFEDYIEKGALDNNSIDLTILVSKLKEAKFPIILAGNGIKMSGLTEEFRAMIKQLKLPVVLSLPAFDLLEFDNDYNFGFIGNNGFRYSNYILWKSDLIVSIGSRLDGKQVGKNKASFIRGAQLIRIDVDVNELSEKVSSNEIQINADAKDVIRFLTSAKLNLNYEKWIEKCNYLKDKLYGYDFKNYHYMLQKLFDKADVNACFTADVGHHEIFMPQALRLKENQRCILSTGLASMGYSLPAAIGASVGKNSQVISLSGDGGIQMNIQELQTIVNEKLPVKVIVFNNNNLGMVREFQERNFNKICCSTTTQYGYTTPNFKKIADAYGLRYTCIEDNDIKKLDEFRFMNNMPEVVELVITEETYLYPRYLRGQRICDMEPRLNKELLDEIESYLGEDVW